MAAMMRKQPKLDLQPRLRLQLAEQATNSRIFVVPGPDAWWNDETDISQFVQEATVFAKVGDLTRAELRVIHFRSDVIATTAGHSYLPGLREEGEEVDVVHFPGNRRTRLPWWRRLLARITAR